MRFYAPVVFAVLLLGQVAVASAYFTLFRIPAGALTGESGGARTDTAAAVRQYESGQGVFLYRR
jgi:hypothetical protein